MGNCRAIAHFPSNKIFVLWIYSTNFGCFCYTGNGEEIGTHAQVGLSLQGLLTGSLVGPCHNRFQSIVDLVFRPEATLQVLHPLEVTDRDAASIGQDIWHDGYTPIIEDMICLWCSRAV